MGIRCRSCKYRSFLSALSVNCRRTRMTPCCKVLAGPDADQAPSLDTSSPTKPMGCRRADLQLMCCGLCRWLNWMQLSPERAAQSKRKSGEGEKLVLVSGSGLGPGHLLCVFVQYTLFWPDLAFTIMAAKCGRAVMWREQAAAAGCSRAVMHGGRCGFTAQPWAELGRKPLANQTGLVCG